MMRLHRQQMPALRSQSENGKVVRCLANSVRLRWPRPLQPDRAAPFRQTCGDRAADKGAHCNRSMLICRTSRSVVQSGYGSPNPFECELKDRQIRILADPRTVCLTPTVGLSSTKTFLADCWYERHSRESGCLAGMAGLSARAERSDLRGPVSREDYMIHTGKGNEMTQRHRSKMAIHSERCEKTCTLESR
jgi:hypothetical protein